ncbi:hypothetical protein F7725_002476, partial [Dissostichus mawsoni]
RCCGIFWKAENPVPISTPQCACAVHFTWSTDIPLQSVSQQENLQLHVVSRPLTHLEMAFRKFLPLFDRVLVERFIPETVTKGGIMLPEKAQSKVLQATVVAVGPGSRNVKGNLLPVSVTVERVSCCQSTEELKISLDDKDYFLFRDGDILGKYVE